MTDQQTAAKLRDTAALLEQLENDVVNAVETAIVKSDAELDFKIAVLQARRAMRSARRHLAFAASPFTDNG